MGDTFTSVACDLCGATEHRTVLRKRGRVTGEIFSIVRCRRCSLVYVNPRLSDERIAKLYDKAYFRGEGFDPGVRYAEDDDENMRHAIFAILQSLREAMGTLRVKRVLDVGCGGGSLVRALRAAGALAVGLDSSPEAIRICRARSTPAIEGDVHSAKLHDLRFDAITAIEVIEHVTSPTQFLRQIRDLLAPGGVAFIGTGNWELVRRIRGTPYIMPEGHLYYFTPRTLHAYFRKVGLLEAPAVHRLWFVARAASRLRAERITWPLVRLAAATARVAAPQFGPFAIAQRSYR
jgi:2-polyprenyl-3-methyl-5-hydroxy-6-metoxy-1,4-benzoquinol methylase